jgi:hypothetical protein
VSASEVQRALRESFEKWGLPDRVRVDNGYPWGNGREMPSALCLWLVGIDVGVIHNPPNHPQANGSVERFHGLVEPWGEPEKQMSFEDWRRKLKWLSGLQREEYPSVRRHQSRIDAYPELNQVRRVYDGTHEDFDLRRVDALLAQGRWRRRVNKNGDVSVYRWSHHVGRKYWRKEVFLSFDASDRSWVVQDEKGQQLNRWQAKEISADRITSVQVSRPTARRELLTSGKTLCRTA